jgi:hypothetical protein
VALVDAREAATVFQATMRWPVVPLPEPPASKASTAGADPTPSE